MVDGGRSGTRLLWLEVTKAIGLVLIVFNHALERMDDYPYIFNPSDEWVPLAERVSQLEPTSGSAWDLAFNAIRYPGLLGEVGVQLFVIASGIGLTLSAIRRRGTDTGFLRRRLDRIAPTWGMVHLLALLASLPILLFIGGGAADLVAAPWDARFWASLVGFRITPETIYYLVPAWWFIALLIQLYLVFPYLYRWANTQGRIWALIGGGVVVKLAGLLFFDSYLDVWSRGAVFVTRLPEFAFGMLAAHWLTGENRLRSAAALSAALVAIPVGVVSGLYLSGNAWGPLVYGAGSFVVLYRIFESRNLTGRLGRSAVWTGRHSLSLFIVHQPVYFVLMPGGFAGPARVLGAFVVAGALTVVGALVLEYLVDLARRVAGKWRDRGLLRRRLATAAVVAVVLYGGVVVADLQLRTSDPQEVLGWGERPSLVADEALGWRMAPSQVTHLRWQGYDYTVVSNELGFTGPVDEPGADDLRILTLGDAFTSAEGVDTAAAWPRLLEANLGSATVWNGAVTGYGPRQYAGVAAEMIPQLEPDVVIVAFFVNDFEDAEMDYEEMRESIGFGKPDATGIVPSLQWGHLSKYLRYNVTEPVLAMAGLPNRTGYLLGQFDAFDPGLISDSAEGYAATLAAMAAIGELAPEARLIMTLVPSSIQICSAEDLDYFPENVDLADYDLDQPQRLAAQVAETAGMEVVDLRPVLAAASACPYHPENMHWLEGGHQTVAAHIAGLLRTG